MTNLGKKSEFSWEYNVNEIYLILEGKAIIKTKEGNLDVDRMILWNFLKDLIAYGKLAKESKNSMILAKINKAELF